MVDVPERQVREPAEQTDAGRSDRATRILREQTGLLLRQASSGVVAAMGAALLLAVPLLRVVPAWAYALWFAALCSGMWLRQVLMERAWRQDLLPRVRRVALVGSSLLGLLLTAPAPLFYPLCTPETRAFLSMVQLVWISAAISVLAVFPLSYKLYGMFSLANIALGWWLSASWTEAALVSAFLVPMWLLLARFADRVGRMIEESVDIRHEREELVQRMQHTLASLEEVNLSRSRFLAAASHDMLQPVYALRLLADLARHGERTSDVLDQLCTVATSIDSMFKGLLDQARFEAGALHATPQIVSVKQMLQEISVEYGRRCAANGVDFRVDCDDSIALFTDPLLAARVLRNLVDNAVKFTRMGGVEVRARSMGAQVQFDIVDTGVGIRSDDLALVCQPFFRGSAARELEASGVGLGLSNASQIVQLLGGELAINSQPGSGTTVRVCLPAANSIGPVKAAPSSGHGHLRFKVVALIEDDPHARHATALWLQKKGCDVAAASDAQGALDVCQRRSMVPEFILADFNLRDGKTGIEAIEAIRARFGPLPAAIVSGDPPRSDLALQGIPWLKKAEPSALLELLQGGHHA